MKRINEDHKEIASGKKKDDEGYMARIELDSIERSIKNLRKAIKSADTQLPAWVQSKITRAADYIDSATEYLQSDQDLDENISFDVNPKKHKKETVKNKVTKIIDKPGTPGEGEAAVNIVRNKGGTGVISVPKYKHLPPYYREPQKEETLLVDKILSEMGCGSDKKKKKKKTQYEAKEPKNSVKPHKTPEEIAKKKDPCWDGYRKDPSKKDYEEGSCVKIDEAIMPQKNGHNMSVTLMWRAKYYNIQMFFPQLRIPNRREVADEANKVYPGCKVITYAPCAIQRNVPIVQVPDKKSKNYLMNNGTIGEETEKKPLGKPMRTPGERKKFKVYVKDPDTGNIITVRFGDPNMEIRRDDPKRLKAFRDRHNCDSPEAKDKTTAKYWSCYQWRKGKKVED